MLRILLGAELARETGLGDAFVGSLFIAITTSLPEVVVSLAAGIRGRSRPFTRRPSR